MTADQISPEARALIDRHLSSMDHVQVLHHLYSASAAAHAPEVARAVGLDAAVVARTLRDLADAGLVAYDPATATYVAPETPDDGAVRQVLALYDTRPVTLVRAIYDRPVAALRSFADAFRLRGGPGGG